MKSKTIIISSENEKGRGILTLFEEDGLLKCKLRLYNIANLSRFCKLGVYHNNEVFSANLLEKNGIYSSSLIGDFDMDKDFYTAIIDTSNNNKVLLSGGTYAGFFFNDNSVFENKKENDIFQNVEKENPTTNLYDYNDEPFELISQEKIEEKTNCEHDCANCVYKQYFYENQKTQKTQVEEIKQVENIEIKPQKNESLISQILPQFNYVFENYENDEILNNLIPNSKFVKINENNEQYSIGAIYNDDEMKYICYAVLCNYNSPAPTELGEHFQWLPLDKEDPLSEGYYVVFQDANDLQIVKF